MIIYKKDLLEVNKKKFEEVEKKCKKEILSCSLSKIVLEIFFVLTIIFFFCSSSVDGFMELGKFAGTVTFISFMIHLIEFFILKQRKYVLVEGNMLRNKYLNYDKKRRDSYLIMHIDDEELYLYHFYFIKENFEHCAKELDIETKYLRSNQYKCFLVDLKKKHVIFDMTNILKI